MVDLQPDTYLCLFQILYFELILQVGTCLFEFIGIHDDSRIINMHCNDIITTLWLFYEHAWTQIGEDHMSFFQ